MIFTATPLENSLNISSIKIVNENMKLLNKGVTDSTKSMIQFSEGIEDFTELGGLEALAEVLGEAAGASGASRYGKEYGTRAQYITQYVTLGAGIGGAMGGGPGAVLGGALGATLGEIKAGAIIQTNKDEALRSVSDNLYNDWNETLEGQKQAGIQQAALLESAQNANNPENTLLGKQEKLNALKQDVYTSYGEAYNTEYGTALDEAIAYYEEESARLKEAYSIMGAEDGKRVRASMEKEMEHQQKALLKIAQMQDPGVSGADVEYELMMGYINKISDDFTGTQGAGIQKQLEEDRKYGAIMEGIYPSAAYLYLSGYNRDNGVRGRGEQGVSRDVQQIRNDLLWAHDEIYARREEQTFRDSADLFSQAAMGNHARMGGGMSDFIGYGLPEGSEAAAIREQLISKALVNGSTESLMGEGVEKTAQSQIDMAEQVGEKTKESWKELGRGAMRAFYAGMGFSPVEAGGMGAQGNEPSELERFYGGAGARAYGLAYVPYNGFPAILHEGERVLTAQQNRAYNTGGRGDVVITGNSFTVRQEADITAIAREIASRVARARLLM